MTTIDGKTAIQDGDGEVLRQLLSEEPSRANQLIHWGSKCLTHPFHFTSDMLFNGTLTRVEMPVTVKPITLWRKDVDNQPGVLAQTLEPFETGRADLHVVMGYRYPGNETKAAIELYLVAGKKLVRAAQAAGLTASPIPRLLVEGDNKPGLGHAIAGAIAEFGVMNLAFIVTQVIGRRYSAVIGFESDGDAKTTPLLKKAVPQKQKKV